MVTAAHAADQAVREAAQAADHNLLSQQLFTWEKALCALFLILLASCSRPCTAWKYEEIKTTCPRFNSACIVYGSTSSYNGLEVELTKNSRNIQMHINVHSLCIVPLKDDPGKALVMITIDGEEYKEPAFWLQGGQRLLLTDKTSQKIIEALICNKTVEIKVGRFKNTLIPDNFEQAYNQLCRLRVS